MIVSITLNPCIDKTIYMDQLKIGEYNRVSSNRIDVCGKGINVSTVLHHLKEETCCMGYNFRSNGSMLERVLNQQGLKHKFVMVDGEIRTNVKLFDRSCQIMTEINEAGPNVPSSAVDKLLDEVESILEHIHILVLSGSIPPGVPADIYRRFIRMAHKKDVKTVLDASGEAFSLGLEEKPFLIKPNLSEFEQAFQEDLNAGADIIQVAQKVVEGGIPYVCISLGSEGAVLIDREHAYRARPLPVPAAGLTGAGDSMVAGICYAVRKRFGTEDMLRYAMAAAGGSIRREGTLLAQEADVQELLPLVQTEIIA